MKAWLVPRVRGWIPAGWRFRRIVRVPVVFDLEGARAATLELRRVRSRTAGLVMDPEMAVTLMPDFVRAVDDAHTWAKARDRFPRHAKRPWTVTWCLREHDGSLIGGELSGGSLGAAFGVALAASYGLSRPSRRRLDPDAFISARLDVNGALDTVTKLHSKVPALGDRATRLLVADADEATACSARHGDRPTITSGRRAVDAMAFAAAPRPRSVPVVAAVLLVLTGVLTWAAHQQADAEEARTAQLVQRLVATSGKKLATEPAAAALAGAAAAKLAPENPDAQAALMRAATVDARYDGVLAENASSVALSPDGKLLAAGGDNHSITLVPTDRSKPARTARAGGKRVTSMAFSRDARYVFTGDEQGKLVRWDTGTLAAVPLGPMSLYGPGFVDRLAVSPDGALLAVLTDGPGIDVYETVAGTLVSSGTVASTATSLVFTDPETILVGVIGNTATDQILAYHAWRVPDAPRVVFHVGKRALIQGVTALAVSGDGRTLLSGDIRGQVMVWDIATFTQHKVFDAGSSVLAVSPDEHAAAALVTTADGLGVTTEIDRSTTTAASRMWDLGKGEATSSAFGGPFGTATVIADDALRTAVVRTASGAATRWIDPNADRLRQDSLIADIAAVPFEPDVVLTASFRGRIDEVDVAGGRIIRSIPPAGDSTVYTIAVSPSDRLIATGHRDGSVLLRDFSGKVVRRLEVGKKAVFRLAFSPDGRFVVTGGDGKVRLWEVATGRQVHEWSSGANVIHQILFDPGGGRVYVADSRAEGGTIRGELWWAELGSDQVHDLQDRQYAARGMTDAPGGRVLVGDGDGTLRLTDDHLRQLPEVVPYRHNANVFALAYSPDAGRIVSGGGDDIAAVLRSDDLTLVAQLPSLDPTPEDGQATGGVYAAAVTGDGRYAVFGGHTGRVQVVPLAQDLLLQRACRLAGRPPTAKDLDLSDDELHEVTGPC